MENHTVQTETTIEIHSLHYSVFIDREGFRFRVTDASGMPLVEAHPVCGLRWSNSAGTVLYDAAAADYAGARGQAAVFRVRNKGGDEAEVVLHPEEHSFRLAVTPAKEGKYVIEARTASVRPIYGMGDFGSHTDTVLTEAAPAQGKLDIPARDSADLFGFSRKDMVNQGTNMRFLTTFAICPGKGFAQVLFAEGSKRASFTLEENMLGANGVRSLGSLYYFFGDTRTIYREYRRVRHEEGYPDRKPKYDMFRVGWEAYGSLGWNAYQSAVEEALKEYRERGYELAWGVVGSGFWKGDRKSMEQGTTTSFNLWDTLEEEGRTDGLPNPRYPDPERMKSLFKASGIKLLLGIRHHFKAPRDDGGYHNPVNNGAFVEEGLERGYFLRREDGGLVRLTNAEFPKGTLYVLDSRNREALDWFVRLAETWGAEGFKEDAMVYTKHYADGNWNPINEAFMDRGHLVIVRNSAYSAPGDVIRINDTYYGKGEGFHFDQDRVPLNLFGFAASGVSNLYPDITGGTPKTDPSLPSYQWYFVRNAMFNAVCPAMSMGRKPWEMQHPRFEAAVKKAADWHNRYAPYIYSSVVHAFRSGYPEAMCPLHIAFPEEPGVHGLANRHTRQYEWMLGPSLLAAPLYGNDFETAQTRDVYLPSGDWMEYDTGRCYRGPQILKDHPRPADAVPVFVGGAGILVRRDTPEGPCMAEVYPTAPDGIVYRFIHPDGISESIVAVRKVCSKMGQEMGKISWRVTKTPLSAPGAPEAWSHGNGRDAADSLGQPVSFGRLPVSEALSFILEPGMKYTAAAEFQ